MREEYDLDKLTVKRRGVLSGLNQNEPVQVKVTLSLDAEVIEHFKREAEQHGQSTYQQQINLALRHLIAG